MEEKQLLEAISQMISKEIGTLRSEMQEQNQSLRSKMQEMNTHIADLDKHMTGIQQHMAWIDMRMSGIENHTEWTDKHLIGLENRMRHLEEGTIDIKKELSERMTKLEISYENNAREITNLLKEDYGRVAEAVAKTSDYDEVKNVVNNHDRAITNHAERLKTLEQKAI